MNNFEKTRNSLFVKCFYYIGTGLSVIGSIFMLTSLSYNIFVKKQFKSSLILVFFLSFFDSIIAISNLLLISDDMNSSNDICYIRAVLFYFGVICAMNIVNMISWIILKAYQKREPSTKAEFIFFIIFVLLVPCGFLLMY